VVHPVGARTSNATNNAGACKAKHMKSASTSTTLRPGSKRGCSTSFGKFGSRLEAPAQAAGGTGANDAQGRVAHEGKAPRQRAQAFGWGDCSPTKRPGLVRR